MRLLKSNLSIRKEVFYIGLVFTTITLVVFGLFFSNYLSSASINQAKLAIKERNQQITIFTNGLFAEISNTIEVLSNNRDVIYAQTDRLQRERALALFKDFANANPNITYIYSGYENGELLINDYDTPAGFDSTVRPWYRAALEASPKQVSGYPYRDASTGKWVIFKSKALLDDQGQQVAVIAIDMSLQQLAAMLETKNLYESQQSFVMDSKGEIIIHSNEAMLGYTIADISEKVTEAVGDLNHIENDQVFWASYSKIDNTDWIIVTAVQRNDVMTPILISIAIYAIAVLVLALLLGVVQSKIIGRRFAEPLMDLGRRVTNITSGKAPLLPNSYKYSNREIAEIASNIEKLAEHSLQKKKSELMTIIESTQEGILVVDENRKVIYVNSSFKEMWHIMDDSILTDEQSIFAATLDQLKDAQAYIAKTEELYDSYRNDLHTIEFKDGRAYERFTCPLLDKQEMMGRLWSFRDITERKRAEEKLQKMATTDELTELWNRRYFMDAARKELERARRYGHHFSFIIFDIDYFKTVNDTLGHAAGDATLQQLAVLLRKVVRDIDVPGRLGGEEFGVLLPGTSIKEALLAAERLRSVIENTPAKYENEEVKYTVSIGVTAYREGVNSFDELFKEADAALYQAKESGRNKVVNYLADKG